jgi:hypothetical protein
MPAVGVVTVPRTVDPDRNSTLATVAPAGCETVARNGMVAGSVN